jgi:ribosomal protein S6
MNTYEFTFILGDEKEVAEIKKALKAHSGKLVNEKAWGERAFAYPIDKQLKSNYYTWQIEIGKKDLTEFKKKLEYNEKLTRYLILMSEE